MPTCFFATIAALASPVTVSAADLHNGFSAALELSPELRAIEADRPVVAARLARADALIPAAPAVGLGWRSDRLLRDRGLREIEGEFDAPLWLSGEASALRALAQSQAAELDARTARQRLLVAGEVRTGWWRWSAAAAERHAAGDRLGLARTLERDLARQVRAGQLPETDQLVATAAVGEAEALLRSRELVLRQSSVAFRALTGLLPSAGPDERPGHPGPADPRIVAAERLLQAGQAAERLARVRDRGNPEIGVQLRHERDSFAEPWGTRALLRVSFPLGNAPLYREQLAAARSSVTAGTAALVTAGRGISSGLDSGRAGLDAATAQRGLAEARHAALAQQARLYEEAYRAGQLPLLELVRVRGQLADADAARRRTVVEAGQAVSVLNQALGLEPQ